MRESVAEPRSIEAPGFQWWKWKIHVVASIEKQLYSIPSLSLFSASLYFSLAPSASPCSLRLSSSSLSLSPSPRLFLFLSFPSASPPPPLLSSSHSLSLFLSHSFLFALLVTTFKGDVFLVYITRRFHIYAKNDFNNNFFVRRMIFFLLQAVFARHGIQFVFVIIKLSALPRLSFLQQREKPGQHIASSRYLKKNVLFL